MTHVRIRNQKFIKLLIIVYVPFLTQKKILSNREHRELIIDHRLFLFFLIQYKSELFPIFFVRLIPGQASSTATSISASNTKNYAVKFKLFINIDSMYPFMTCRKKCTCLKEQVCHWHVRFITN